MAGHTMPENRSSCLVVALGGTEAKEACRGGHPALPMLEGRPGEGRVLQASSGSV